MMGFKKTNYSNHETTNCCGRVVIFTIGFIVKQILDPLKNKTIKITEDSYLME